MPEAACLHIQAGESDPVRVVELPGASVRIGRASHCDVRLPEPEVADEECLLRRRGSTWHLVPVARPGSVVVDGAVVERPRPLPYGVPLRVGDHSLTLRPVERPSVVAWGTYQSPIPGEPAEGPRPGPDLGPASAPRAEAGHRPGSASPDAPSRGQERLDRHEQWLKANRTAKRWEQRWRAAGERLRERPVPPATPEAPSATTRVRPAPRPEPETSRPYAPDAALDALRRQQTRIRDVSNRITPAVAEPAAGTQTSTRVEPATGPETAEVSSPPTAELPVTLPPEAELAGPALAAQTYPAALEPVPAPDPAHETPGLDVAEIARHEPEGGLSRAEPAAAPAAGRKAVEAAETPESESPASAPAVPVSPEHEAVAESRGEAEIGRPGEAPAGQPGGSYPEPFVTDTSATQPIAGILSTEASVLASVGAADAGQAPVSHATDELPAVPSAPARDSERRLAPTEARAIRRVEAGDAAEEHETAPRGRGWAEPEWPSAREVFEGCQVRQPAAQVASEAPRKTMTRGGVAVPQPTVPRGPAEWSLPLWLAWFPATLAAIVVAAGGTFMAWTWARDAVKADRVARRLAGREPAKTPLLEPGEVPETRWWKSSGSNLAQWAAYLDRTEKEPADPALVAALMGAAGQASPLNPTVRFAAARPDRDAEAAPTLLASLGLGRDVITLAWAGHQFLKAGKQEPALRAYRRALEMASRADASRLAVPAFVDDAQTRRYTMPHESLIGPIVRDMADHEGWTYADWSEALPAFAAAPLAAARALKERRPADAEKAIGAVLAYAGSAPLDGAPMDVHVAAQAEALALVSRWDEAEERYRQAIDLASDDRARRSWWFNLADVELRLNEEAKRQKALEAAKSTDSPDDISQRAVELQRLTAGVGRPGGRGASAERRVPTR